MCDRRAGALWVMVALISIPQTTAWALEQWPDQPIRLPYLGPPPNDWSRDRLLGLWTFNRKRVGLGGIFVVPEFGGVFFGTKADLEIFENSPRQMQSGLLLQVIILYSRNHLSVTETDSTALPKIVSVVVPMRPKHA